MAKGAGIGVILVLMLIGVIAFFFFSNTEDKILVREFPNQINGDFVLTYKTTATGDYGIIIEDSVTGGCKFPDGSSQLKTVMLSPDGNSKTITVTAESGMTCIFSGDYDFITSEETQTLQLNTKNVIIN